MPDIDGAKTAATNALELADDMEALANKGDSLEFC